MNDDQKLAESRAKVMLAFAGGAKIEITGRPSIIWAPCPNPSWNWGQNDYRVVSEEEDSKETLDRVREFLQSAVFPDEIANKDEDFWTFMNRAGDHVRSMNREFRQFFGGGGTLNAMKELYAAAGLPRETNFDVTVATILHMMENRSSEIQHLATSLDRMTNIWRRHEIAGNEALVKEESSFEFLWIRRGPSIYVPNQITFDSGLGTKAYLFRKEEIQIPGAKPISRYVPVIRGQFPEIDKVLFGEQDAPA